MIYEKEKNNQRTVSGTVSNDRCDLCGPDHRHLPPIGFRQIQFHHSSLNHPARLHSGCNSRTLCGMSDRYILGGAILPDIIVGSMATLLGAIFTYLLKPQQMARTTTADHCQMQF